MEGYLFLFIIMVISLIILWINRNRNAWDVMMYNTTLAIIMLFMIGLLENNVWDKIVLVLGAVATRTDVAAILKATKRNQPSN